jgi:Ca2+-binding EF-hand superfamily protein
MQPDIPEETIRSLIQAINSDGKGKLSFDEFVQGMHWLNKVLNEKLWVLKM